MTTEVCKLKVIIEMCVSREKVQRSQKLNHAGLARLSISKTDNSYKFLLEEAVTKCTCAVNAAIWINLKALTHQLLQAFVLP
jgi:hypothetical protein